jgi:hypothetical protein
MMNGKQPAMFQGIYRITSIDGYAASIASGMPSSKMSGAASSAAFMPRKWPVGRK